MRLNNNLVTLKELQIPNQKVKEFTEEERARLQKAFGYTFEEYKTSILPMAQNGAEPIASMGTDSPLPMLSNKPQP